MNSAIFKNLPRTWPLLRTTDRAGWVFDVIVLFVIDFTITFVEFPVTCCWRTTIGVFCKHSLSCVLETFEIIFGRSGLTAAFRSGRLGVDVVTMRSPDGDSINFCPGCNPVTLVIFPSGPRMMPSFWRWFGCGDRLCCYLFK